jgi:FAD-linked oxidoreductase
MFFIMENWAGNVKWTPQEVMLPKSEEEIADIIKKAVSSGKTIRTVGSHHSFTPLLATNSVSLSLDGMQGLISKEPNNRAVAWSGTKLKRLSEDLAENGLALENMGDINVQSVAGAISTGTHGTGITLGSVGTQVEEITFVNGLGELITLNEENNYHEFKCAQLSLGSLGVITRMKMRCKEAYNLELDIRKEKLSDVLANLDEIVDENRHFEFYSIPNSQWSQTKRSNIVGEKAGHTSKISAFINDIVLENWALQLLCSVNKAIPSSSKTISNLIGSFISNEKKIQQSHKVFSTLRNVKFTEMEYNIPYESYQEVVKEMLKLIDKNNYRISFPQEHRFVQADDIYLSPAHNRNSAYIASHVYKGMDNTRYFKDLEDLFVAHGGRPHWGKMHARDASFFTKAYPKFDDFLQVRAKHDPNGIFLNDHLKKVFGV